MGMFLLRHHAQMVVLTGKREGEERESKERMRGWREGGERGEEDRITCDGGW